MYVTINIRQLWLPKFTTGAENDKEQTCYFNCTRKDKAFNRFSAVRIERFTNEIVFPIVSLKEKPNRFEDIYYKLGDEL